MTPIYLYTYNNDGFILKKQSFLSKDLANDVISRSTNSDNHVVLSVDIDSNNYKIVDGAPVTYQLNVASISVARNRELIWEHIKQRRYEAITSGVYINSIDKWFHTDEVSVTTYSTIAGMIALNNYEPVQWKTMDNTWLLLTVELFKELQTAISIKTNANYAVAEQHKAAMLQADNPLDYDYSTDWV